VTTRQANPEIIGASGFRALESAFVDDFSRFRARDPWARLLVLVPSRTILAHLRESVVRAGIGGFQLECQLATGLADAILSESDTVPAPAEDVAAFLVRHLAVRLADSADSRFRAVARRGGFHESLLATFRDLDESGPNLAALQELARTANPKLAETLRLYLGWRQQLEALGLATVGQRLALAADAAGSFRIGQPVWTYGFYDLTGNQRRLIEALSRDRQMRIYLPLVGGMGAEYARPTREWFAALAPIEERPAALDEPGCTRWFNAAGERREVTEVARRVRRLIEAGVRPGRIGVIYRHKERFRGHVREVFGRAGLALASNEGEPLRQGRVGRGLRLFLEMAGRGTLRSDVIDFLDLALAETEPMSVAAFDTLSKTSGVTRGEASWRRGLERALRRDADAAATVATLAPHLDRLFGLLREFAGSKTFKAMADRLVGVVDQWFAADPSAGAVRTEVLALDTLDRAGEPADAAAFEWLLDRRLQAAARVVAHDREGIVTGDLVSLRGLDFDHLFLSGVTERSFPGPVVQDPILLDAERRRLSGCVAWLPLKRSGVDEEKLFFELMWESAQDRTLSWSRLDPAKGRPSIASSFLLEAAARELGHPVGFRELDGTGIRIPLDHLTQAREAGRRHPDTLLPPAGASGHLLEDALDDREFDQMLVMAALGAGRPERVAFLRADPAFDRCLEAAGDRWRPVFTSRDGALADPMALEILARRWGADHVWSATELETCATCPMRFLLERGLGLKEEPNPEDAEQLTHLDRGLLLHAILQEFLTRFGEELTVARGATGRGQLAAKEMLARGLSVIVDRRLAEFGESGLTGHPLLWSIESERIRLDLAEWLDFELTRMDALVPHSFELRFGRPPRRGRSEDAGSDPKPARVELGGGRVERLGGYIDRVDVSADGRVARIVDYKSGRVTGTPKHPLDGGRRLQLATYRLGLAARAGAPTRIDAEYLFLAGGTALEVLSDETARGEAAWFAAIIRILADTIRSGFLPAWPEREGVGRCACPYPSVCGVNREDLFERKRDDPRFAGLAGLDEASGVEVAE